MWNRFLEIERWSRSSGFCQCDEKQQTNDNLSFGLNKYVNSSKEEIKYTMATNRSFAKDFHNLLRNISSISGGQACISDWDDDDVSKFDVEISPSDGLYKGGKFKFQVRLSNRFINIGTTFKEIQSPLNNRSYLFIEFCILLTDIVTLSSL